MKTLKRLVFLLAICLVSLVVVGCKKTIEGHPGTLETPFTDSLKLTTEYKGKTFLKDGIGLASKSNGVDGDTAQFKEGSSDWFPVRFLGINTPESTINLAPWGPEASAYCKKILKNAKEVVLEAEKIGKVPEKDTNNTRYLGYVWYRNSTSEDFRLLNIEMIEQCFTYFTGNVNENKYGKEMQKAFERAYKLKVVDEEGKETKVGVFGQVAPGFDYSTEVRNITIAELKNNFSSYSTGTKLKMTVRVARGIGKSLYVEDIEASTNPDTGIVGYAGIYLYDSYKMPKDYEPGTILTFECQASESETYGRQLINPSKLEVSTSTSAPNIQVISNDVTYLKDYEGMVVKVEGFTITRIGHADSETGSYTIYGTMQNGAELMVRVDGSALKMISSTSAYLKVGNVYDVTGGVSQFTVIDTGETFYQIKLGNNAIALGDFEKINTIGEN